MPTHIVTCRFSPPLATREDETSENDERLCQVSLSAVKRCAGSCQQEAVSAKCTNLVLLEIIYRLTHPELMVYFASFGMQFCVCVQGTYLSNSSSLLWGGNEGRDGKREG